MNNDQKSFDDLRELLGTREEELETLIGITKSVLKIIDKFDSILDDASDTLINKVNEVRCLHDYAVEEVGLIQEAKVTSNLLDTQMGAILEHFKEGKKRFGKNPAEGL